MFRMDSKQFRDLSPVPFLIISTFGLSLLVIMVFYPPSAIDNFVFRKPLIGTFLVIECLLGMLATIYPRQCSRVFKKRGKKLPSESSIKAYKKTRSIRGHHPDCENYSTHVFEMRGKCYCSGCTGLFLGATITIAGTFVCFFVNLPCGGNLTVFSIGCIGIVFGLLQFYLFVSQHSFIRVLVNAFFVFGVFLAMISVDSMLQNTFVDLFLISLSFFWIYTRIVFSRWNHERICQSCNIDYCEHKVVKG